MKFNLIKIIDRSVAAARLDAALDRANRLRQRAISCRHAMAIAHTLEFRALLARQAADADARADFTIRAMKETAGC